MSSAADQQHKLLSPKCNGAKLLFKDIEVPPRKLLLQNKKSHHHHHHHQDICSGSPRSGSGSGSDSASYLFYPDQQEMNILHNKFLPFNNTDADSDPDSDPYASDHFRMYEFKIRRCTRSRSHDWTDCPFAHPGEKARRRDPRRYHYSGDVCSEYRRGGGCSRGDDCEFAHGVFECWLHPSRYRTEACKDGKNCKRKVCFFAHSPRQLRILPEISSQYSSSPSSVNNNNQKISSHCCMYCHHHSVNSSPTSTLLGNMSHLSRSPSLSPPLSPVKHGLISPISRYSATTPVPADRLSKFSNSSEMSMSYKDVLNELMTSMDAISFNEVSSPMSLTPSNDVNACPWIDVSSFNVEDQQQLVLSPSTPSPSAGSIMNPLAAHHDYFSNKPFLDDDQKMINYHNHIHNNSNGSCQLASDTPDPDLGWVNELLT